MTSGPVVSVIGASGGVGRHLCGLLGTVGVRRVRLGIRRSSAVRMTPDGITEVAVVAADVADPSSLDALCRGAAVVVNCAGPIGSTRGPVLAAAARAGADYIDSGPADAAPVVAAKGRRAVLGAGATPGLSELLIRWLAANSSGRPRAVTGFSATWDVMTAAAAADVLDSLAAAPKAPSGLTEVGSAGVAMSGPPLAGRRPPFFPGDLIGYPFLRPDTAAVARSLALEDVAWYELFEPQSQVLSVLSVYRMAGGAGSRRPEAIARLRTAANAVMAGREPFQQFVVEQVGTTASGPTATIAILRGRSTYRLTAALLAAGVAELLAERIEPGGHLAALALRVESLPFALRLAGDATVTTLPGRLDDYAAFEAGAV